MINTPEVTEIGIVAGDTPSSPHMKGLEFHTEAPNDEIQGGEPLLNKNSVV